MASTIKISAKPNTDIWRKPPNINAFNAPFTPLARKPLPTFSSAQLSLTFTPTTQYDQAGLLLTFHPPPSSPPSATTTTLPWIKTGVELYNGSPRLSTVACTQWADWSVAPLLDGVVGREGRGGVVKATIRVERVVDHHGPSLWVYAVGEDGRKEPLREVCWVFALGKDEGEGDWEAEVAAMAARPAGDDSLGELVAEFTGIEVTWD